MENRDVHLGYLVVHDARLSEFAHPLIDAGASGQDTVVEIFVDVRPHYLFCYYTTLEDTQKRTLDVTPWARVVSLLPRSGD